MVRSGCWLFGADIAPVGREGGWFGRAAQQCHRISQIGIEDPVMLDHRDQPGIADQRTTERADPEIFAPARHQPQRDPGRKQRAVAGSANPSRAASGGSGNGRPAKIWV